MKEQEEKYSLKKWVYRTIVIVMSFGLMIPFLVEAVLPSVLPSFKPQGVQIWNQFSSTILGIVATVLSIVSLILCFLSRDEAIDTAKDLKESVALCRSMDESVQLLLASAGARLDVKKQKANTKGAWTKEEDEQ